MKHPVERLGETSAVNAQDYLEDISAPQIPIIKSLPKGCLALQYVKRLVDLRVKQS